MAELKITNMAAIGNTDFSRTKKMLENPASNWDKESKMLEISEHNGMLQIAIPSEQIAICFTLQGAFIGLTNYK